MDDQFIKTMDSSIVENIIEKDRNSLEASIEPQVKEEQLASTTVTTADSNATSTSVHQYSTRSKDKLNKTENKLSLKQKQHNVIIHPRLKPLAYKRSDLTIESNEPVTNLTSEKNNIKFYQCEDHPFNKRGFKYKPCKPNPIFRSNLYSTTEFPPFTVRPSYFDRSQGILFNNEMDLVTTLQGWRSIRANICIREGKYYMEFNIINANNGSDKSHVRIGLARREASLEAPVGFDGYGYGLRDITGQKITLSRPKEFMKNDGFKTGDAIGILIEFPSLEEHKLSVENFLNSKSKSLRNNQSKDDEDESSRKKRKVKKQQNTNNFEDNLKFNKYGNISRDQIPIKYKNSLFYEQYDYTATKKMDHLLNPVTVFGEKAILENKNNNKDSDNLPFIPNSKIRVFKNGIEVGTMFENLFSFLPTNFENDELNLSFNTKQQQNPNYRNTDDGSLGYYPMLSVFQGGIVGLNPGPKFKYPIDGQYDFKPLIERYNETIIEEWYWDLIDEIEAEYLDSFDM